MVSCDFSMSFHVSGSLAAFIHVLFFFFSSNFLLTLLFHHADEFVEVVFPSFSVFRYFCSFLLWKLKLGFHRAAAFVHLSSLCEAILMANRHFCEGVGDVVGVEAPLGGVAQVIFHGVQVVEVGVQVRVHQDRGVEEDGEGQVEVEREVDEDQGEPHMCDMA